MAQSFTATATGALAKTTGRTMRHFLVTGAAGRIGSYFSEHSRDLYRLRLMVREDDEGIDKVRPFGEVVYADLGDLDRLKEVCEGVDTVIHMAGDPDAHATWRQLRAANIDETSCVVRVSCLHVHRRQVAEEAAPLPVLHRPDARAV